MSKINVFISHRWDYEEDYDKISAALDRSKYDVSDRSVESSDPLVGTKKAKLLLGDSCIFFLIKCFIKKDFLKMLPLWKIFLHKNFRT